MILNKKLIEYGVILGLISVAISVFHYMMGIEFMIKWWVGLINIAVSIGLVCYFGNLYRKGNGGYLNYWNSYVAAFIMMAVSGVFGVVFSVVLFHYIDTDLPAKMHDAIINLTIQWMQDFKVPQDKIDQQIDQMQKQGDQFTVAKQIFGYIWVLVGSAIFSFLIAAITKRNKPLIDVNPIDQAS